MSNNKSKLLLILGCQRSGTSLLAAMLGGHSEINMLYESITHDVFHLIGKEYNANKLLLWRQIRKEQKSSKLGHLINRISNLDFALKNQKYHKVRPHPTCRLSINDYINKGAKVVTIVRDKTAVISSMMNRSGMTQSQAEYEYDQSMREMESVKGIGLHITFHQLVNKPTPTLTGICDYLGLEFEERMLRGSEYNYVYPHDKILADKSTQSS